MLHTILFRQSNEFICNQNLTFGLFFTGNIKIIIITGMTNLFCLAYLSSHFSGKYGCLYIILIKICYSIFMSLCHPTDSNIRQILL